MASSKDGFHTYWTLVALLFALHIAGRTLLGWSSAHVSLWMALGFLGVTVAMAAANHVGDE